MTEARRRDAVLVTGPRLAGSSSVAAALRDRLPDRVFLEPVDLGPGEVPVAVVFVVSAAAALTGSDCGLLDGAAVGTDVVICALTKIDTHRGWRDTLVGNRVALAAHAPRYRRIRWAGVAAAPEAGPPRVEDLVDAVRTELARSDVGHRNTLRLKEARLCAAMARATELQRRRTAVLRSGRRAHAQRAVGLRSRVQQARLQLSYFARSRCAAARTEWQDAAARLTRRDLGGFEAQVRDRADAIIAEVAEQITSRLAEVARRVDLVGALPVPDVVPPLVATGPPRTARRLEARLMLLLGAGFGLGVAVSLSRTLSRLLADVTPGLSAAGMPAGLAGGVAVTLWVVGTRGLLHDRAVADRWVGEVTALVRSVVDQLVATRVLAAEAVLAGALGEREDASAARVAEQVSAIDRELRDHAAATTMAAMSRTLDAVRAELGEPAGRCGAVPPYRGRAAHDNLLKGY